MNKKEEETKQNNNRHINFCKVITLEKWFPLRGERVHSLKSFVCTIRGLRYQKQNRMEEEREPQT